MKIKNYLFGFIAICTVGFSVPAIAVHSYSHAKENPEKVIKMAKQGDAQAQYYLGWFYERGNGVGKNYVTAVQWFRKAAEQGHAKAQCRLGEMYEYGGVYFRIIKSQRSGIEKEPNKGTVNGILPGHMSMEKVCQKIISVPICGLA